ncbi:TIGR03619 family F420-dependent LLM class oxidoreductase [Solirubrobacter soli]|uniref:TIGR03619 family F420-dependent LLM class oxidoreductase n=1 Tax=Solirubrobacter soli TaxID=363832 RepID=UPI0004230BE1|nr:TIGR03619 family F420-dependent LLM class oxidoreductase [Solirubrobacter soli]
MRIGAKLPNSGPLSADIPAAAVALERAGFDSLWVADHIVMPERIESPYPFGQVTWATDIPYVDALIALALAAAVTTRVRLGTAALVLPQRNPVQLAKQAASIDVASGGRLELGVGAGWLAEEFAALNVPFERRGARMDEWIAILRECWTGRTDARRSEFYDLPEGTLCLPAPSEIPILIGGHSPAALRRAARNSGWLAQQDADKLDPSTLVFDGRIVLRIVGSLGREALVAERLKEFDVDEVIVDVPIDDAQRVREVYG